MPNPWFQFKQFLIRQDQSAMKVTTDGCLFGAWVASLACRQSGVGSRESGPDSYRVGRQVRRVLDIGTGTGLLSLMLAQQNPDISIDAVEIDAEAVKQAKENVDTSPWKNRVTIIHADVKTFIFPVKYDCIISNPPFYEKELKSENPQKNRAYHSDELSLKEVLRVIKENLAPGGIFFLLLPFKRDAEIKTLLSEHHYHIQQISLVRQSTGHDFFRIMLAAEFNTGRNIETIVDEIAIKDQQQQYTPAFISLLKDYYLYL